MNIQEFNGIYNPPEALERALALSALEAQPNKPPSSLPLAKVVKPKPHAEEPDGCSICLETWADLAERSEKVVKAKCGHMFCEKEITDHVVERGNTACPLCQAKVVMAEITPVDMTIYKVAKNLLGAPEKPAASSSSSSSSSLSKQTLEKINLMKINSVLTGSPFFKLRSWEKAIPLLGTLQSELKDVKTNSNIAVGSVVFVPRTQSAPTLGIIVRELSSECFLVLVDIDLAAKRCFSKSVFRNQLIGASFLEAQPNKPPSSPPRAEVVKPKPHAEEPDGCSICLEAWTDLAERSEKVVKAKCGHMFCEKEITDHVVERENRACPLCQAKVVMAEVTPVDMTIYKVAKNLLGAPAEPAASSSSSSSSSLSNQTLEKINLMKKDSMLTGRSFFKLRSWEKAIPLLGTLQSELQDVKTNSNIAVGSVVFVPRTQSAPTLGIIVRELSSEYFLVLVDIDLAAKRCFSKLVFRNQLIGVSL